MENKIFENVELVLNNTSNYLKNIQKKFMESSLYKALDSALDSGIKTLIPDIIEDEVIEIKDAIFENGLVDGVKSIVNSVTDFGKDIYGMVTGNFESIDQLKNVVSTNGTLDRISDFLEEAIKLAKNVGVISKNTKSILQSGKDILIDNIDNKLTEEMKEQEKNIKVLNKYFTKWEKCYEKEDFESMENIMKDIEEQFDKVMPFKDILEEYNRIETLHNLIKNNGQSFDLSQTDLELVEAFANT